MRSRKSSSALLMVMPVLLLIYLLLFMTHEERSSFNSPSISPSLPIGLLNVIGHSYLNQFIAEALFVKTAVYYGGLNKEMDEKSLHIMAQHFVAMSQLHPRLLDTYYRSESVLAHKGNEHVKTANKILERGRSYLPEQVSLPFFEGFNYFNYLDEPLKAAKVLRIASAIPDAPQWIGHLASMLMASSGNIRTGLIWLKGILSTSQIEDEKTRYKKEIIAFEKAMQVQLALNRYLQRTGTYPTHLDALLVSDLVALPSWEGDFVLEYQPPKLFLRREQVR